jgi:hypothetical protein
VRDPKMNRVTNADADWGAHALQAPAEIAVARQRRRLAKYKPRPATGSPVRGRAWINGREVGGGDPRYDHLAVSHD